jgi:hypothetical protein
MAETDYSKYVTKDVIFTGGIAPSNPRFGLNGNEHFGGLNYWLRWNYIPKAHLMEKPHKHDYDQLFHVFSADSTNVKDVQAEIWVYLGDKGEYVTITGPAIIFAPAGLTHGPIDFKRVDKPVILMNVAFPKGEYVKHLPNGKEERFAQGH